MAAIWLLMGLALGAGVTALVLGGRLRAVRVDAARAGELERDLVRAEAERRPGDDEPPPRGE